MIQKNLPLSPIFSLRPQILLLISTLLYFFPYAVGSFEYISPYGWRYRHDYHADTIYIVAFILTCLFSSMVLIKDRVVKFSLDWDYRYEHFAILLLIVISGSYLILYSPDLYSYNKAEVLEGTNRINYIYYYSCGLGVIYALLAGWRKHLILLILGSLGLISTLYIGHRSYLAITIGGIAYLFFRNRSLAKINPLYIAAAFAGIMFLAVYKSVYVAIKMGDFAAVRNRLLDNPLTDNALIGLEQFVTFAHLDFIFTYDYTLPCTNIWKLPIAFIPFMDELVDISSCGYNAQVQQIFFSSYSGGVAANIWAEFYAIFGYAGMPIVILLIVLFTKCIEYFISMVGSPLIKSGLIMAIIELTIYIQRKEMMGAVISAKRVILVALLAYACAFAIRSVTRSPRSAVGVRR